MFQLVLQIGNGLSGRWAFFSKKQAWSKKYAQAKSYFDVKNQHTIPEFSHNWVF
jgi:hypothetical protein